MYDRRELLALAGLGIATTAGCLDGGDTPTTDTNGGGSTGVSTDTLQLGTTLQRLGGDDHSKLIVIDSAGRAETVFDPASLPSDRDDEIQTFIEGTDFETSVLVFVQTTGPNTCYDEIDIEEVGVTDGELTGSAAAIDTSEGEAACGEAITAPSVLVRATVDGTVPGTATFSITNGWGETQSVTASASDSLGIDPASLPGHVRPDGEPATIPAPLSCPDEGFTRQESWVDDDRLAWGETDGQPTFALRVDTLEADYGDTVTVTLTNVSGQSQVTGNRHKHVLQVRTEAGWESVWGHTGDQPLGYTDEGIIHEPGTGFEWNLELTEDGVLDGHYHEDTLRVCPDLQTGRYRFVSWEPGVAVAFDLSR